MISVEPGDHRVMILAQSVGHGQVGEAVGAPVVGHHALQVVQLLLQTTFLFLVSFHRVSRALELLRQVRHLVDKLLISAFQLGFLSLHLVVSFIAFVEPVLQIYDPSVALMGEVALDPIGLHTRTGSGGRSGLHARNGSGGLSGLHTRTGSGGRSGLHTRN